MPTDPDDRVPRFAVVTELAAYVLYRDFGPAIRAKGRAMSASSAPTVARAGRDLLLACGQFRSSADQVRFLAGVGTSEQGDEPGRPELTSTSYVTAKEVAAQAGCSESYVTRRCRGQVLDATFFKGRWLIDEAAAAAFVTDFRSRS